MGDEPQAGRRKKAILWNDSIQHLSGLPNQNDKIHWMLNNP
jgi:hypothetical protein